MVIALKITNRSSLYIAQNYSNSLISFVITFLCQCHGVSLSILLVVLPQLVIVTIRPRNNWFNYKLSQTLSKNANATLSAAAADKTFRLPRVVPPPITKRANMVEAGLGVWGNERLKG